MTSITRTLTTSLTCAAVVIFLMALAIVVGFDLLNDPLMARCEAAAGIVEDAVEMGPPDGLAVRSTKVLQGLEARGQNFWYAVSHAGRVVENHSDRRPKLPFDVAYAGSIGRSVVDAADHRGTFCLDANRRGSGDLVIMVSGAHLTFVQLVKSFVWRNAASVLFIAIGFAATVVAGAALSSRFVSRSIARVTRLAVTIDPTAPRAAIPLRTVPVELVALVTALNRAFHEIDEHMGRQRRFIGNAAHELRTPLTLLRAKVEEVPDPSLKAELVQDIRRLASLVSAMLDLATLQGDAVERRPVNLGTMTHDVLADLAPSALDSGIELALERVGDHAVVVLGFEAALRSAVANLIDNALLHARGATAIVTVLERDGITISDNGAGLQPGQERTILEPFQKGEGSKEGAGLGLSIVSEIMAAHGGSLRVSSTPGRGTSIQLRFPRGAVPAE